jgi:AcrR family transcriptional regulator
VPKETFFNLNEEKQEKVIRAAINEFLNKGFEKGNIGEIARNAGVAKGSMYQYFEDKKELFLYTVEWSIRLLVQKYGKGIMSNSNGIDVFDFYYKNARDMWMQMAEEREVIIFIQDVFLGKYSNLIGESMDYMMKASEEMMLDQIRIGKENGSIRKDIEDKILSLFMTGVSFKIKEYMMNKARSAGVDMIDEAFEEVESDVKAMIELLKNGMGTRN